MILFKTVRSGGRYYYLKRQWRPQNNDYYGATATDTIYDYMSVVSSNYRNANYFIDPNWLVGEADANWKYTDALGVRGTQTTGTNDYYRMASNQATLVEAFEQAVTYASTTVTSTSGTGVVSAKASPSSISPGFSH